MDKITYQLRQKAINEEFDYTFLKSLLSSYQNPRDKITRMLKNGEILRIKKGLYVFGPNLRKTPYSKEVLANLIYGPSYLSLEYALAFYNLIPERVETVTSVTNKKNKVFQTSVGLFTYQYLENTRYQVGLTLLRRDATHSVLIATKEKALADLLFLKGPKHFNNKNDLKLFLTENLRMEIADLKKMSKTRLRAIATAYKDDIINLLLELLK